MISVRTFSCATAYAVLVTLTISPLLSVSVPPLSDYPNHLARMWILAHGREIPELTANYVAHWRLIPNLAMDLVVPPLARIMPVEVAGRLFIMLSTLGLIGGTITLHYVLHRQVGLWPLCSLLFLYNYALFLGLLSFLFGAGVFLLALSGWIGTQHWSMVPRLLIFAPVASLLFILHLFAFGLYGLSVMSYELGNRIQCGRWSIDTAISWCVIGLQFLPAAVLWLASLPESGPTYVAYGDLGAYIVAFVAPFTFGHMVTLDGLFAIFYGFFLLYATRSRSLRIAPQMRLPIAALVVAAVLMPQWLSGSWGANIRLPVILPFVIIASTRLEPSRQLGVSLFAAVAVVLLGVRTYAVAESWRDYDRQFAEFREASQAIPLGTRLLAVQQNVPETQRKIEGVPSALAERWELVYVHMAALAVIDRSVFIPYLFTGWTPVEPTSRNAGLFRTEGAPITPEMLGDGVSVTQRDLRRKTSVLGEAPYWSDWPEHFNYVVWIDFGEPPPQLPANLQSIARGSFFRIYRVLRPQ